MDKRIKDLVQFNISRNEDGIIDAEMVVNEKLPSFEGHFPGHPILPAVSIIDISLYLLENSVPDISYNKIQVKRSKFMAKVEPNSLVSLEATTDDGKNWKVLWRLKKDMARLAQVHLVVGLT